MSYVIEEGIPAPAKAKRKPPEKGAMRLMLESLLPGQSVLLQTSDDYDRVRSAASYISDKQFVCRKIPSKGWRVWRVE